MKATNQRSTYKPKGTLFHHFKFFLLILLFSTDFKSNIIICGCKNISSRKTMLLQTFQTTKTQWDILKMKYSALGTAVRHMQPEDKLLDSQMNN